MSEMVIDFDADGTVESMHRETVLDLGFLGNQRIVRATDIRHNNDTQKWDIYPSSALICIPPVGTEPEFFSPPSGGLTGFASYEQARGVEVAWLEYCRLHGIDPLGVVGLAVVDDLRK